MGGFVALAKVALRDAALRLVRQRLQVEWYEGGALNTATARDDKYQGAWLVYTCSTSGGWETYVSTDDVERRIEVAEGFPFAQFGDEQ